MSDRRITAIRGGGFTALIERPDEHQVLRGVQRDQARHLHVRAAEQLVLSGRA